MADITRKQNDTAPITAELKAGGDPADLSDALGVRFLLTSDTDAAPKVDGSANIVDETDGVVRYYPTADDVDEAGYFIAEWEVEYTGGDVQTFPNNDHLTVEIIEDID